MIAALKWIGRRWYIPVLALVGLIGFIVGARRRNPSPMATAKTELEAVDAGERARLLELKRGRDEANAAIDLQYREAIHGLEARQKREIDDLRRDPARRARVLARISSKRPGDPF